MQTYLQEERWLVQRSKVTGVPKEIRVPIVRLFMSWVRNSGPEWAVSRLKSIRTDFLRKKAGLDRKSVWIRSGRKTWFGGPFGALESWASNGFKFGRAIAFLGLYTNFYSKSLTETQKKKFLTGVTFVRGTDISPLVLSAVLNGVELSGLEFRSLPDPDPILFYPTSPDRRGPTPFGSRPESESILDSIAYLKSLPGFDHYLRFQRLYDRVLGGFLPLMRLDVYPEEYYTANPSKRDQLFHFIVGKIGFIQEPGFKLRYVANPGRVFQAVLSPLGDHLFSLLRTLPWDCTHNQAKADNLIQCALSRGCEVYSVDLTSATDFFPLELQEKVLLQLVPFEHVSLFKEISLAKWEVNLVDPLVETTNCGNVISWKTGQPLGLYPSFASFALTHGLLLLGLLGRRYNGEFAVLGDDVVVFDKILYERYRDALALLSCPVSESKTIQSNVLAEFRSVVYFSDQKIPQFKWRSISDDNFYDLCRNLGPSFVELLSPRQKAVVRRFCSLPEDLGGLGWNPNGLTLSERMAPFFRWIMREDPGQDRLTSYLAGFRQAVYHSLLAKLAGATSSFEYDGEAFDQKAMTLASQLLGNPVWDRLVEILGRNLDSVVANCDLPIPGLRRFRRKTTLQKMERWLDSTASDQTL